MLCQEGTNMSLGYYRSGGEVEDAMAVTAKWISNNRGIKVVYHKGSAVDADVEKGVIRIPRMACASGVTEEALMLLRGRVYHEAGHVDCSRAVAKADYPIVNGKRGAKMEIWNALEDRRMEAEVASKHAGCGPVFAWSTEYYNKQIGGKVTSGEVKAPLWEALVAMSFRSMGKAPAWKLTDRAQAYYDAAYDKFSEWRKCADAKATLDLAGEVYKLLEDVNEEYNDRQDQQGESEEQDGEGSEDEKESKGKKDKKSDKKDKKDKKDSKGEDKKDKGEKKDSKGEDEDGEEGTDEGEEQDGEGEEGEEKDGGAEGEGEGEEGEEGEGEGEGEGDEDGEEGGSKGSKGEGEGEGEEGELDGEVKPGDSKYEPQDEEAEGGKGDGLKTRLDEEIEGVSQEQVVTEALKRLFGDLDPEDCEYLSRRDLDRHEQVEGDDEDKASFKDKRESMSVGVASLTGALEQALRSLTRVRRNPYQRHGKIDRKRLVAISKGLSKEVFYRKTEGLDLDVAVELVIDESGSMGGACREVGKLAIAIGESLKAIGVPFEITGSTTAYCQGDRSIPEMDGMDRTNPIVYRHYKTFDEDWASVRQRLVHVGSDMHNVDGEVVEYAAFRLAQRKERRKIVFSLSDGEPCAGHGNDMVMAKNLRKVCKKARKSGVEVYGFGVGTYGPEPLYGKENFMFLEKADSMGPEFVKDFARKVTGGMVRV
jgi:cobalamin biosynthesis protein CobT